MSGICRDTVAHEDLDLELATIHELQLAKLDILEVDQQKIGSRVVSIAVEMPKVGGHCCRRSAVRGRCCSGFMSGSPAI